MNRRHEPALPPGNATDAIVETLPNGVRVVVLPLPHLQTASVSVFVRSGSQHETPAENGVSHVIEHMAFKGTRTRSCQRINVDAERLGADVNAHTDKDHTAFHMRGRARDAEAFVGMLGDIVRHSVFPEDELERERQVLLQEFAEDEDDPMASAFKLFDRACFGDHSAGQPVIGTSRNLRRFERADLVSFVQQRHTGSNMIVGGAGRVDADRFIAAARAAFGDMAPGDENGIAAPPYVGGIRSRRLSGCSQAHIVLGFPVPALPGQHQSFLVAAALLGEGMSSPLLDRLRERRGLVYHADCSADVRDVYGQFIIEASTLPQHIDEFFSEVVRMLHEHVDAIDPVGLERARNQLAVRMLRTHESSDERLERAALDLFALRRVRPQEELRAAIESVTTSQVRDAFVRMLEAGAAVGLAGKLPRGIDGRVARMIQAQRAAGS